MRRLAPQRCWSSRGRLASSQGSGHTSSASGTIPTLSDARTGEGIRVTFGIVKRRTMSAMTPDTLSDLLACVAAFGRSLDERFDPARFLAEFSARSQRLVPHDYMLIALREDDGQTFSLFAEYAGRGGVGGDTRRYTTAFERGGRAATESFALAPVFGGETERLAAPAPARRVRAPRRTPRTLGHGR